MYLLRYPVYIVPYLFYFIKCIRLKVCFLYMSCKCHLCSPLSFCICTPFFGSIHSISNIIIIMKHNIQHWQLGITIRILSFWMWPKSGLYGDALSLSLSLSLCFYLRIKFRERIERSVRMLLVANDHHQALQSPFQTHSKLNTRKTQSLFMAHPRECIVPLFVAVVVAIFGPS